MESLVNGGAKESAMSLVAEARRTLGSDDGRVADPAYRAELLKYEMDNRVFRLAQRRAVEESQGGTPGAVTSIFKVYGSELQQTYYDLMLRMRGVQGFGDVITDNPEFDEQELQSTRDWLFYRAASIYSGSNEVQRNIIAKRVLGLPD